MPIKESDAAKSIVTQAQKGLYDCLARRSERMHTLYEGAEFDDISGDSFARAMRQGIKGDRDRIGEFDVSPGEEHYSVVEHWEHVLDEAGSLTGDDEEVICKIAEGKRVAPDSDIAESGVTRFWGTSRVTAASYLSWSMLDTMASSAYKSTSFSLSLGGETLDVCVEGKERVETSIFSSNVLAAGFMPGLSADFRLSTSSSSIALFHPGFNNVPDIAYSPCVLTELDVVEKALKATYPGTDKFNLTLKPTDSRPSTDELIQMNEHFGFMLSDSQALLSTGHGFAKSSVDPTQPVYIYDVSATSEYSASTLNFRVG